MVFLLPLIGFLIFSIAMLINRGIAPEGVSNFFSTGNPAQIQGVFDQSGIIREIPSELSGSLMTIDSEAEGISSLKPASYPLTSSSHRIT
jgi:hypothetical protein